MSPSPLSLMGLRYAKRTGSSRFFDAEEVVAVGLGEPASSWGGPPWTTAAKGPGLVPKGDTHYTIRKVLIRKS